MNAEVPAPGRFTAVAIIALLWNRFGVAACLMTVMGPALLSPERRKGKLVQLIGKTS